MRLDFKQLKQLVVETLSGEKLGHVYDVVFEIEGQLVAQYIVRSSILSGKEYVIAPNQVVRFEETRMIVDDTVTPILNTKIKTKGLPQGVEPVSMRTAEDRS